MGIFLANFWQFFSVKLRLCIYSLKEFVIDNELQMAISDAVEIPKCLADLFESVAGGIVHDSDSFDALKESFFPLMNDALGIKKSNHVISLYHTLVQMNIRFNRIFQRNELEEPVKRSRKCFDLHLQVRFFKAEQKLIYN